MARDQIMPRSSRGSLRKQVNFDSKIGVSWRLDVKGIDSASLRDDAVADIV